MKIASAVAKHENSSSIAGNPARRQARHEPDLLVELADEYYGQKLEKAWGGVHPMKGLCPKPNSVQMRTNDYLCIADDQRIIDAEVKALRRGGHGDAVSRIWKHHETDSISTFEQRLARLMYAESSVLCSSGYTANVGLIQALAKPSTPVYLDVKAHKSLWEGVSSAKALAYSFRHNDANHLERQINTYGPGIVVVDALYSTDGDICPLNEIIEVVERSNCVSVVDETHSFGTQGPGGSGLVVKYNLSDRVDFRTLGLSKAVAARGGAVVTTKKYAEIFRYESHPNVFSTSVLPHEVAGFNAALDIFETELWRRQKLEQNHAYLRSGLNRLGYNVDNCQAQIIALEAGDIRQTMILRDALEYRGVFGALFWPPAVPEKRCLIRFTVNCNLTSNDLNYVLSVCEEIREEINLDFWRSTKRRKGMVTPVNGRRIRGMHHQVEQIQCSV